MRENTNLPQVQTETSVVEGSLWMIGISLLLFFVPMVNGVIAGFVGGYKVGTVKRAITAAVLPAVISAIGLWLIMLFFGMPLAGLFTGFTVAMLIILSELGLFLGAFLGGMYKENQVTKGHQHPAPI